MSDCCKAPDVDSIGDSRCPRCGATGRRVLRETMESLLKREARDRLVERPYYFDCTPHCDVVYFSNEARSYFYRTDLIVPVGLKETKPPVPLCYCFGHTTDTVREEILATGRSSVVERVSAEVRAGNCSCELKNPSGRCCLGDLIGAVRDIQLSVRSGGSADEERQGSVRKGVDEFGGTGEQISKAAPAPRR